MSRSGYTEDCDIDWDWIRWRGAVHQAIIGKRGQAFLREMLEALDALPEKKLIAGDLIELPPAFIPPSLTTAVPPSVCAIGAVGLKRGTDLAAIDPEDQERVAREFGVAHALVAEIVYANDETHNHETPEARYDRMRAWVIGHILETT
jgi:hypothetical protein